MSGLAAMMEIVEPTNKYTRTTIGPARSAYFPSLKQRIALSNRGQSSSLTSPSSRNLWAMVVSLAARGGSVMIKKGITTKSRDCAAQSVKKLRMAPNPCKAARIAVGIHATATAKTAMRIVRDWLEACGTTAS
jgi:hypothetical protein